LLGGKIVLLDVIVVQGPLDFNMFLRHDYVYSMNVVVSTLFRVMHFLHNGSIFTIDQLTSNNHHPNSVLVRASHLYVPSVVLDSTLPQINYVASYPQCSISPEHKLVYSYFPSQDLVLEIDPLVYPMGAWEPLLPPLGPSNLEFPFESNLTICRYSSPHACESSLIDSANSYQNLHHHMEYGQFASPFWNVDPTHSCYFLDIEFPLDDAILEAITTDYIQWEDLHRGLCFLPFWETF
jgi:hypothetical protein